MVPTLYRHPGAVVALVVAPLVAALLRPVLAAIVYLLAL